MSQKLADIAVEGAKVSPPVAVIAVSSQGMTLQDWVLVATLAYIGLQAGWLVWKWYRALRTKGWTPKDE